MSKQDPNRIAKFEKAIASKYGEETIQNPRKHWDDSKEEEYKEQIKKIRQKAPGQKRRRRENRSRWRFNNKKTTY